MRIETALVALAFVLGCERDKPAAPQPSKTCLADELGPLTNEYQPHPECTPANRSCLQSCNGGDASSCLARAASLDEEPDGRAEAAELYGRACKLGLSEACTNWASLHWFDDVSVSEACLYRVFEKTCALDDYFACGMMGRLLVEHTTDPLQLMRGRLQLELACNRYGRFPCHMLAMYIEREKFGAPDPALTAALMKRACDTGDAGACKAL